MWGDIRDQRGWLKGTRKRLLDAANGIKGGREVVGWVERRTSVTECQVSLHSAFLAPNTHFYSITFTPPQQAGHGHLLRWRDRHGLLIFCDMVLSGLAMT